MMGNLEKYIAEVEQHVSHTICQSFASDKGERERVTSSSSSRDNGGKGKHNTLASLALTLGLRVTTAPLL